jgi:hypothetical protein
VEDCFEKCCSKGGEDRMLNSLCACIERISADFPAKKKKNHLRSRIHVPSCKIP